MTKDGGKEYLPATEEDREAYQACAKKLRRELKRDTFRLPTLERRR